MQQKLEEYFITKSGRGLQEATCTFSLVYLCASEISKKGGDWRSTLASELLVCLEGAQQLLF